MKYALLAYVTRLDNYLFTKVWKKYDTRFSQLMAGVFQTLVFAIVACCDAKEEKTSSQQII